MRILLAFSLPSIATAFVGRPKLLVRKAAIQPSLCLLHTTAEFENDQPKPKSRLAQLAEDWLEEEEDELTMYWERFSKNKDSGQAVSPVTEPADAKDEKEEQLTTEQRLEQYFDSRGIHKRDERKFASQIERAISKAQSAATPEEAIVALSEVQPYLQVRTRLGGMALYELAVALWQRDGEPDNNLMRELVLKNSYVKQKVQQLARRDTPPKRNPSTKSFWQGFMDSNQWWN